MNLSKIVEMGRMMDLYSSLLTAKQTQVLNSYVNFDGSLSEIAEELGVTRQAVADLVKRSTAKLYELEKNLGFCAKLDKICNLIPQKCKNFGLNEKQTAEIIDLVKMVED